MKKLLNWKLLLVLIVAVAGFLRIYALDKIPGSLSADEASLGYTSFSLLKAGIDQHGNFFPIAYSAFGSAWTLIGYPLLTIISQLFFGLNEFSIRLPSALSGTIGVIFIFFIADILFKNKRIAIFAALVYAISPWNIYFSRMAYETNLALAFFLGGLLCLVKYLYDGKKRSVFLILSALLFAATLFIYYSYVIFLPLFCIAAFLIHRSSFVKNKKFLLSVGILAICFAISFYVMSKSSINEASTQGIFNNQNIIYQRVEKFRTDKAPEPILVQRLIHNKYLGVSYQFVQNYLNSFAPDFLFDKGGNKIVNDIGYFGKLYLMDALFLIIGFAGIFYRREKSIPLLSVWFLTAPIASALTIDAPSSTRLFVLMPLFTLIIAFGINQSIVFLKSKKGGNIFVLLLGAMFLLNFCLFIDAYFVHFNYQRVRFLNYGYKQIVEITQKYPTYNVVMRGPENFPYIYFLIFNQYDPRKFISQVKYYPPTGEGFVFVKNFGRFSFPKSIDNTKQLSRTIYIDDNYLRYKNKIYLPSGEPILSYSINK
jgi:4-amino-4-deoxy-L-arabinose transferase-like glycosyltransferase